MISLVSVLVCDQTLSTVAVAGAVEIIRAAADTQSTITSLSVTATIGQPTVLVINGQRLEIECPANGDPIPSISWQKDGTELVAGGRIQMGEEGTLQLRKFASKRDAGTYTCVASNRLNSDQESIEVLGAS